MKPIRVHLKERSYDICFGAMDKQFALRLKKTLGHMSGVLIVSSEAVAKAGHVRRLEKHLSRHGLAGQTVVLPNGERHKNLGTVAELYRAGFEAGLDRRSVVIALGGGVITDLAGFFAATYMRGISFVSIPSTLLGMVDAAIGGKTGVDVPEGKNLVGSFWQPRLVWLDPDILRTLPMREWRTGFAEVIKYGVIKSRPFFEWLETRVRRKPEVSAWPQADIAKMIETSARIKALVVSGDEREKPLKGGREILNFGHTAGHALEAAAGFSSVSHGEAISIGMAMAGRLALARGLWSVNEQLQLLSLLEAVGLPIHFPKLSKSQRKMFWSALQKDKKHVFGRLRFVLPRRIGSVAVQSGISLSLVNRVALECGFDAIRYKKQGV